MPHDFCRSDTEEILAEICEKEPLVTEKRKFQVFELIEKLKSKLAHADKSKFGSYKVLRAHILPLTNVAFDKSGKHFITGSYDRTCKIWETETGSEVNTLEGHRNVVYAIAFNLPFSGNS
ncbi:dynein assembly factor with WDR repeat domains 1 [Paragonimus westermani]|uniref:Dynein assembly factor with WDR repeat domains 1 n=1 Tax=Paragonimus westermani TaxID=34504 RepID=A0A5J4NNS9_9TREM|nr:dynein assembly factor with WDR repeat domains 1 [Paragonimus westermani]